MRPWASVTVPRPVDVEICAYPSTPQATARKSAHIAIEMPVFVVFLIQSSQEQLFDWACHSTTGELAVQAGQ